MEMPELSNKTLLWGGASLVLGSIIIGYFTGIGTDLWQITKEQVPLSSLSSPFWLVSVPLGVIGIILIVLAYRKKPPKVTASSSEGPAKSSSTLPVAMSSASFEARIRDKKSSYHEGQTVEFWAQYTGKLDKGYFSADIIAPLGTTLPNGKQRIQVVDPATYHSPWMGHGRMGRVSGTNTAPREWGFQIPSKWPIGKCQVIFEVWDGEFGEATKLGWKEDSFVVDSEAHPAREFTAEDVGPPFPIESVASSLEMPNIKKILTDWLGKKLPDLCNIQVKSMDQSQDWSELHGIVQDSELSFYHFKLRINSNGRIDQKESYVR